MRTVVGVLRGGTSSEYNLSLKTGAAMIAALPEEKYETRDILIDKTGLWHLRGKPMDPTRALAQVDVILNALHGGIGEDGTVQRILQRAGVRYAGSAPLPSSISLHKIRAREVFEQAGIRMPRAFVFRTEHDTHTMAKQIFAAFGPPYVVKPPSEGSSHGIRIAATIVELPTILASVLEQFGAALVEEFLLGSHATVGVIAHYRREDLYTLPPARHQIRKGMRHFTFEVHESGAAEHLVPSRFSDDEKGELAEMSRTAHKALGLGHFSDADFVVTRRGPYLLEMNATPHLYAGAVFPKMLESVGSSTREFLEHAITLAKN
jgi:D-alanine-D-alanine ligase